jgi:hypothetical protein
VPVPEGSDEPLVLDDEFVRAAAIREDDLRPKPSKESLREVKREAKQRRRGTLEVPGRPRPHRITGAGRRVVRWLVVAALLGAAGAYVWSRVPPPPRHGGPGAAPGINRLVHGDDAFAGTKVEHWAAGAAGIKPPVAAAIGPYGAAAVADAYARSAALLRATLLDDDVVYGGATGPVFRLMQPVSAAHWRAYLPHAMTRFDPHVVARTGQPPRVKGVMAAALGDDGALRVSLAYVTVYALRPAATPVAIGPTAGSAPPELVVVRHTYTLDFRRGSDPRHVTRPWVRTAYYVSDHSRCDMADPSPRYVWVSFDDSPQAAVATHDDDTLDPKASVRPGCAKDTSGL